MTDVYIYVAEAAAEGVGRQILAKRGFLGELLNPKVRGKEIDDALSSDLGRTYLCLAEKAGWPEEEAKKYLENGLRSWGNY